MGEVGLVSSLPAARGEWDQDLFLRFRRARRGSRQRDFLCSRIIRENEPLIIRLTHQLRGSRDDGKAFSVRFGGRNFARVLESEKLEWEDALNAGRIAMAKALDRFDASKGSLPNYLKKKIFYELQALVGKAGIVTVPRGEAARPYGFFEDGDHMDRVLAEVAELDGDEPAYLSPEQAELELPLCTTPFDAPAPPPIDTRTAIEVLLDEHLHFARHGRCAETPLRARHRRLAIARGEDAPRMLLLEALRHRDVRVTRIRVEWSDSPVDGFMGCSLQTTASPKSPHGDDVGACGATSQTRVKTAPPYVARGGYDGQYTREAAPGCAAGVTARADR